MMRKTAVFVAVLLAAAAVANAQGAGMKKIVMVIAAGDFRDEEYFEPKAVFEKNGYSVATASTVLDVVSGVKGGAVKPDILLKDVKPSNFDAIVFVGGSGAEQYWDDPVAHALAKDFLKGVKITSAICIGPVILARAGVLRNKKATVFESESGQLADYGSQYTGKDVESDGLIITAAGPFAAKEFGEKIVAALSKQ
jgi:protease I